MLMSAVSFSQYCLRIHWLSFDFNGLRKREGESSPFILSNKVLPPNTELLFFPLFHGVDSSKVWVLWQHSSVSPDSISYITFKGKLLSENNGISRTNHRNQMTAWYWDILRKMLRLCRSSQQRKMFWSLSIFWGPLADIGLFESALD